MSNQNVQYDIESRVYLESKAIEFKRRIHVVEVVEDNGFKCIRYEVR